MGSVVVFSVTVSLSSSGFAISAEVPETSEVSELLALPSISISTNGAPTLTTSPTSPLSFVITPSFGEGISATTLSVSICTKVSPTLTLSPTLTYHSKMVPSSSPSPKSGKLKVNIIRFLF